VLCGVFSLQKSSNSLGVKSFAEIMREKRQKCAVGSLVNTSKPVLAKPVRTVESKQTAAAADRSSDMQKTKPESPKKYIFTPIVFDLDSNKHEKSTDSATEQRKRNVLDSGVNTGSAGVQQSTQLTVTEAVAEVCDDSVARIQTSIAVSDQQSVPLQSDLTTAVAATVMESPSAKSEDLATPVVKRQSSSSSNPPSDAKKRRRSSVDNRW